MHNFIPNEIITCNDKDPPWFNEEIRQILNKKDELFKQIINNGKLQSDYGRLQCIGSDLVQSISSSKEKFHLQLSAKLSDPSTSAKTYWSIPRTFVNGKKIPLIPPLLVKRRFANNFFKKANIFNDFFSEQCQPISNDRILLLIPSYYTDNRGVTLTSTVTKY